MWHVQVQHYDFTPFGKVSAISTVGNKVGFRSLSLLWCCRILVVQALPASCWLIAGLVRVERHRYVLQRQGWRACAPPVQVYVQSSFQQSESGDYASSATKIWECDAIATPVCSLFGGSQDFGFGDYAPETLSENLFAASAHEFQGNVAGIVASKDEGGFSEYGGFNPYTTLSHAKFAVVEGVAVIIHSTFPGTRAFDANAAEWISLTVSGAPSFFGKYCAVATLGVQVYVFGGLELDDEGIRKEGMLPDGSAPYGTKNYATNELQTLTLDVESKSGVWTSIVKGSVGSWPAARYGHSLSTFGTDTLLLFGGFSSRADGGCPPPAGGACSCTDGQCTDGSKTSYEFQARNDVWIFTASSKSWQELSPAAPAPSARRFFGSAVVDSTLFVVGGDVSATESKTSAVDDVWAWDGLR